MLGRYQKYMPKPSNIADLKTALLSIWNDLLQKFIERQCCHLERDFDRVLLQLVDILNVHFKLRGQLTFIKNSSPKRLNC